MTRGPRATGAETVPARPRVLGPRVQNPVRGTARGPGPGLGPGLGPARVSARGPGEPGEPLVVICTCT